MIALQSVKYADIRKMGKMGVGTSSCKCYVFGAPARVRTRDPLITNEGQHHEIIYGRSSEDPFPVI